MYNLQPSKAIKRSISVKNQNKKSTQTSYPGPPIFCFLHQSPRKEPFDLLSVVPSTFLMNDKFCKHTVLKAL